MSDGFLSVDVTFHDTVLVDTNGSQNVKSVLVTRIDTVKHETDDNLLPSRATLIPEFRFLQVDDVANVLHNTVQGSGSQLFVFVVIGNSNQQFGVTVVHGRSQVVTIVKGEFVRVTSSGSV